MLLRWFSYSMSLFLARFSLCFYWSVTQCNLVYEHQSQESCYSWINICLHICSIYLYLCVSQCKKYRKCIILLFLFQLTSKTLLLITLSCQTLCWAQLAREGTICILSSWSSSTLIKHALNHLTFHLQLSHFPKRS